MQSHDHIMRMELAVLAFRKQPFPLKSGSSRVDKSYLIGKAIV